MYFLCLEIVLLFLRNYSSLLSSEKRFFLGVVLLITWKSASTFAGVQILKNQRVNTLNSHVEFVREYLYITTLKSFTPQKWLKKKKNNNDDECFSLNNLYFAKQVSALWPSSVACCKLEYWKINEIKIKQETKYK